METLAFIYASAAYEDPSPEPRLRSLEEIDIPNAAWLGVAGTVVAVTVLSQAPAAQAALKRGDACGAVSTLQSTLENNGYSVGGVDGVFGNNTEFAVKRFQSQNSLYQDGIVGPSTATAMGLSTNVSCSSSSSGGGGSNNGSTNGYVTVQVSALNVRSGASQESSVINVLYSGDVVGTTGRTANGFVELSRGGWISAYYTNIGGQRPPGTSSSGGGGGGGGSSSAYVSTNGSELLVRSGPGLGYPAIDTLPNGSPVSIVSTSGAWGRLPSGGWASLDWIAGY